MDGIAGEMSAIAGVAEPDEALRRLIEAYVATVFANPSCVGYDTEWVNLALCAARTVARFQRAFIETWTRPLMTIRPVRKHAKFLVHALTLVEINGNRVARGGEIPGPDFFAGGRGYGAGLPAQTDGVHRVRRDQLTRIGELAWLVRWFQLRLS